MKPDGEKSWGEYKEGKEDGFMIIEYPNKDVVINQFKDGKRNGYGVFKWANGASYHGQFVDGN